MITDTDYSIARPADGNDSEPSEMKSIFSENDSVTSSRSSLDELTFSVLSALVDLFFYHSELKPLYDHAIATVGPDKFERNFRRLLQRYGRNLQHEATNRWETEAAKFVRTSRRQIAAKIKRLLFKEAETMNLPKQLDAVRVNEWLLQTEESMTLKETQDESSSSDESECSGDTSLHSLDNLKSFMISSEAFKGLCVTFRQWLESSEDRKTEIQNIQNVIARETLDPQNEKATAMSKGPSVDEEQALHKVESAVPEQMHISSTVSKHSIELINPISSPDLNRNTLLFSLSARNRGRAVLLLDTVIQSCKLAIRRCLSRPNVLPGYLHVSWTCVSQSCFYTISAKFK